MNLEEKKKKLQSLNERELRGKVLIPLFQALGFSDVYETHGPTEKGKDMIFRETSKLGEPVVHAAVVSTSNITARVEDSSSAQRIIDQVRMALDEPYQDKHTGRETEVDRCWVVTSGRILSTATDSISGNLRKTNLSKVVRFVDVDRLIELIDQSYSSYWSEGSDGPHGQRLERFDASPDGRFVISRAYVLEEIWLRRKTSTGVGDLIRLPTCKPFHYDAVTLWSPDCSYLAYYIHSKRGNVTDVFEVGEQSAKLLERPSYDLPCYQALDAEGIRHHGRFGSETPLRWVSKSKLILLKKGRVKVFRQPLEWIDYEYEAEIECAGEKPQLICLKEISLVTIKESSTE
jgi:hypothetical protein